MSQSSSGKTEVRYAQYIEDKHSDFLTRAQTFSKALTGASPFATHVDLDIEDAFFGSGLLLTSYASLYEKYDALITDQDPTVLYNQVFASVVNGNTVNDMITAENSRVEDSIEQESLPRFTTGMRDINAVMSSSFVIGKALIEDAKIKAMSRYSADIKGKMLPMVNEVWRTRLDWNKGAVETYAQFLKFYLSSKMDTETHNADFQMKNVVWPFTILHYEAACLGALQNAVDTKQTAPGSGASKAIGGALMGAAGGASMGAALGGTVMGMAAGPFGAIAGGLAGLVSGLF
jgi:hypothetical protein